MKIYTDKLDRADFELIAEDIGVALYNYRNEGTRTRGANAGKTVHSLTLRPVAEHTREVRNGRRLFACNWDAHRDFMETIFRGDADATIDSAFARYNGREEFNALHEQTRDYFTNFKGKVMRGTS
jgi:hypothetical protein